MKLIKVPYDYGGLGKTSGVEKAPDEIAKHVEDFWLSEGSALPFFRAEDVNLKGLNHEAADRAVLDKIKNVKESFIILGGNHAVTHPAFKGFASNFPNAGIVVFDAHPDSMPPLKEHNHENFLRTLVAEGVADAENVIIVGLRNWDKQEYDFLRQNKIKFFTMKEKSSEGKEEVCNAVMSNAKDFEALYLSIDIDAVDPAFAPGTGYPEPGGLTSRELLYFLQRIKMLKNLKGIDLVEINPEKDINSMTVKLGAKIVVEML